jgi:hypothetical protein
MFDVSLLILKHFTFYALAQGASQPRGAMGLAA